MACTSSSPSRPSNLPASTSTTRRSSPTFHTMRRSFTTTTVAAAAGIALLSSTASAFSDTSPFIISHPSERIPLDASTVTTSSLVSVLHDLTAACSADTYLLITLPRLHSSDLHHYPHLHSALPQNPYSHHIPFVIPTAEVTASDLLQTVAETAKDACGAVIEETVVMAAGARGEKYDGVTPRVVEIVFDEALKESRDVGMVDRFLQQVLDGLPTKKTMVLVASTPVHAEAAAKGRGQESDVKHGGEAKNVDMTITPDLRRREAGLEGDDGDDDGEENRGSLFERYQFFTPALFMGYIVLIVILGIGYVGVSALSGLKVSYGAFEKEAGPNAQKKGQ